MLERPKHGDALAGACLQEGRGAISGDHRWLLLLCLTCVADDDVKKEADDGKRRVDGGR